MIAATAAQPKPTRTRPANAAVELIEVSKHFGTVAANDGISLDIRRGEILALLGENGAGKTTLLNLLSGVLQPDSGEIRVGGLPVRIGSPDEALRLGVGTVYQHFTLVPSLTVLDNMLLGTRGWFLFRRSAAEARIRTHLASLSFTAPLGARVRYLSMGERQRLEIAKALYRGTDVLLLDEPTAVLTPGEADALFDTLRHLRDHGVAVVLITHKLGEALSVADRVAVLRAGRKTGELEASVLRDPTAEPRERIIQLMFGGQSAAPAPPQRATDMTHGHNLLSVRQLKVRGDRGGIAVDGVSFELKAGEIFGVAGVDGNGQTELAEAVVGQRPVVGGEARLVRHPKVGDARDRIDIAYLTDDRLGEGIVSAASVADNLVLKLIDRLPFASHGRLNRGAIEEHARHLMAEFDIRAPGPRARAATLSGGNLQKLLLARELAADPSVLVCKNPTHGLDTQTARFVLRALRRHADRGRAVLLLSSELDDLLAIADRIGVLFRGRLVGVAERKSADVNALGRWMVGDNRDVEVGAA